MAAKLALLKLIIRAKKKLKTQKIPKTQRSSRLCATRWGVTTEHRGLGWNWLAPGLPRANPLPCAQSLHPP